MHNASILSAVGACGLQLYRYGEARPNTLAKAYGNGLCSVCNHTLVHDDACAPLRNNILRNWRLLHPRPCTVIVSGPGCAPEGSAGGPAAPPHPHAPRRRSPSCSSRTRRVGLTYPIPWPAGGVHRVLHGHVAAAQLLRAHRRESARGAAHAVPAGHQSARAVAGVAGARAQGARPALLWASRGGAWQGRVWTRLGRVAGCKAMTVEPAIFPCSCPDQARHAELEVSVDLRAQIVRR